MNEQQLQALRPGERIEYLNVPFPGTSTGKFVRLETGLSGYYAVVISDLIHREINVHPSILVTPKVD